MDSIKTSGYIIFVVRGELPLPNKQNNTQTRQNQMYVSIYDIEKHHKDNKNRKLNMSGADERELEEALQRSLKDFADQKAQEKPNDDDEEGESGGVGTVLNKKQENNFKAFGG